MLDRLRTIYARLTAGGTTEEQAVQSGFWVAGINIGDRVLQLLKVIILARLLSPEAFGLLGIALLVLSGLRRFSKLGFDEALIHHKDETVDEYLNTAWLMKIARGLLIASAAFFSAPYLADFFNEPLSGPLIQVMGVANLLLAMQNPAIVYFRKDLNFHKEFWYKISARLVDLIVAVGFALVYRTVWALVAGLVAMNAVQFILSYLISEFRPTIEFDINYAKEMFSFGKWMFIQAVLMFLFFEADDAFVGWYFTATSLGLYQLAYRYSNAPATEVSQVIGRVAFPAYSQVQDDIEKLREGFFRVAQMTSIISIPMSVGIIAVAPQFVYAVLGDQWAPIIPLMQALAIWGGIRAFSANCGAVFKAVGRPDYDVRILFVRVSLVALAIFPAAEALGVLGVIYVIVGQNLISIPYEIYMLLSIIGEGFREIIQIIFYPLLSSLVMFSAVIAIDQFLLASFGLLEFAILIVIGVVVYTASMVYIERKTSYEFVHMYRRILGSI